jgi:hypothetical protein
VKLAATATLTSAAALSPESSNKNGPSATEHRLKTRAAYREMGFMLPLYFLIAACPSARTTRLSAQAVNPHHCKNLIPYLVFINCYGLFNCARLP